MIIVGDDVGSIFGRVVHPAGSGRSIKLSVTDGKPKAVR
jgi:hypothetical protein